MSYTLATSNKSAVRSSIYFGAFIGLGLGMIAAFGSIAKFGQTVNDQATQDIQLQRTKETTIARTQVDADIAKARQKAGIGSQTDQFYIVGVTPANLIDKAEANAESLTSAKRPDVPLVILDKYRNVVGTFDGGNVCTLNQICKRIR